MTIISHKHRLIHLHNQKSAGTSFEVALSKYCGPDDVITPENELFRRQQNFMTARNYKDKGYYFRFERQNFKRLLINFRTFYRSVLYKLGVASAFESFFYYYPILFYPRIKIWRHSNLGIIQEKYGKSFDDYLKISIIRDPIEQFACFYDYRKGIPQPDDCAQQLLQQEKLSFDDFANLCAPNFFRSNQNIIDFRGSPKTRYIRYEHLYDDIQLLESDIPGLKGLSETLASIHLKRTGDLKPRVVSDDTRQVILNHAEFMRPFYPHLYSTVPEDDMAPFEEFPQAVNN